MKYALDTEFIDTPTHSELISLALVSEDNRELYLEFPYTESAITPWLQDNVVVHLNQWKVSKAFAAKQIEHFITGNDASDVPSFWCYYGAYDWYWFCRVFGGFLEMPPHWPHLYNEFYFVKNHVPDVSGPAHHALNDARSLMKEMVRTLTMRNLKT